MWWLASASEPLCGKEERRVFGILREVGGGSLVGEACGSRINSPGGKAATQELVEHRSRGRSVGGFNKGASVPRNDEWKMSSCEMATGAAGFGIFGWAPSTRRGMSDRIGIGHVEEDWGRTLPLMCEGQGKLMRVLGEFGQSEVWSESWGLLGKKGKDGGSVV